MYIYNRPSQDHNYSYCIANLRGRRLGAENDVLHGLGKRPEVMSPAEQAAEVHRLKEEMTILVQKNAWSGVERTYERLETISKSMGDEAFDLLPNAGNIHFGGAEASRMLGRTLLSQTRLLRGKRSLENRVGMAQDPTLASILDSLEAIEKTYGAVTIAPQTEPTSKKERKRLQGRGPALIPVVWPVATDQRRSIEFAGKTIRDTGEFTGLLPKGDYTLADLSFTVNAGTELTGKKRATVFWGN